MKIEVALMHRGCVPIPAVSAVIVKALIAECGIHKAFVLGLDSTTMNTASYWVHLTELELPACQHNNFWTWAASISEIV